MKNHISLFILIVIIVLSSNTISGQEKTNDAIDFTLTDIEGVTVNLFDELANEKTVILNFFSTDCGSCILEVPIVDSVYRQFGSGTGELLAWGLVSMYDAVADIEQFVIDNEISFPCFSTAHTEDVFTYYDIYYTPQIIIVCNYVHSDAIPNNQIIENLNYCFPTRIDVIEVYPSIYSIDNGIIINNDFNENAIVYIYDILGKLVVKKQVMQNEKIEIRDILGNSIYIIDIISESGKRYNQKVLVK